MTNAYRKWSEVRADRTDLTPEVLGEARRRLLTERTAYRLAEIRKEAGLTQTQLAEAMGVSQNRVSVIERGKVENMELDTLRAYVEALGGTVRVTADFADHSVDIHSLTGSSGAGGKQRRRRKRPTKQSAA